MFEHLQIYDPVERRLVALADVSLAIVETIVRVGGRANRLRQGYGGQEALHHTKGALHHTLAPQRILLLRLERIGDLMMAVPAIRAVRALAPHAEIDLAVGSWNASLARVIPGVSQVHVADAPWLSRGGRAARRALWHQARRWRAREYDLAINFEGDVRSHVVMRLSGARRRVGFDMAGGGPVLTDRLTFDPQIHTAANALKLVAHAFDVPFDTLAAQWLAPPRRSEPRIEVPEEHRARATKLLAGLPRPLVGVQAGGGRAIKQWPPERFGAVAAAVAREHGGTIVLTGAASDRSLIDEARRAIPSSVRVVDVSSTTDLVDVAAILQQLDLFISGDTGPLHLADAVGTAVVGVYGLTTPVRWGPLSQRSRVVRIDLACSPCNRVRLPPERCVGIVPDCLSGITAEAVAAAASAALSGAIPLERT